MFYKRLSSSLADDRCLRGEHRPSRSEHRSLDGSHRDTVQLTIYNSEDLTLVRETRKVSFKPGVNALQFSWANTLIDPSSVELRFLTERDKLEILDTTFPHDKPQMLYWNVQSEINGEAVIEITYFTSGISWSADYECIADARKKTCDSTALCGSRTIGEEYETPKYGCGGKNQPRRKNR